MILGETFCRGSIRRTAVQFKIFSQVSGANGKMRCGRMVLSPRFYWYVLANDGASGIDASIILAQAALERLCWTVYVGTNGGLSKAGFKRLPAADQLRLLLARAGMPLSIPDELQELRKLARKSNWDGADAFVNLRNSLVHPGQTKEADFYAGNVGLEAWHLGMWYLELILLHLFDYNGVYSLRLKPGGWVGDVENVPWLNSG